MKYFYANRLQILLWILGSIMLSHKAQAQYTMSTVGTGKYYTAVASDQQDNIYTVAYNAITTQYQVLKYINGTGIPIAIYQGLSYSVNLYPWGITVNSSGDVFITDPTPANNWQIIKLAAGTYTSTIIQTGRYFTALTVDNDDNLLTLEYDASTSNHKVVRYAADNLNAPGTTLYNGLPLAVGSDTYPWGIVADAQNNIYVIDFPNNAFNGRLIKLTAPGYAPTTLGSGKGYTSLAIDAQGSLYTTEIASGASYRIMKYTAPITTGTTGDEIYTGLTLNQAQIFYPWGLAADSHGNIFAGDGGAPGNGRLIKLSPSITVNSVNRANSNPIKANTVAYTVTFSDAVTNVTTSAFSITTTGITGALISSVTGSGTTYTVTINTGTGDGSLRLNVTGSGVNQILSNVPYNGQVYTIDKTPPTGSLAINWGAANTNSPAVRLSITSSDATRMSFSTDDLNYSADVPVDTATNFHLPAGDGLKTVYLKLTDAAGNIQTYQAQITLDQTTPNGTITSGPPLNTRSTTATFTFNADKPATFAISLDGVPFAAATSPLTLTGLATGGHTLQLRAKDLAGNIDPTPDTYSWTIDVTAPSITSVGVPPDDFYHTGQSLDFTVNYDENVTVNTFGGTPSLPVIIGAITQQATYVSGSGSTALLFRYTVQHGDMDMDGISAGSVLQANSGSIVDAAGNAALLQLQRIGATTGVCVNTASPTVTIAGIVTSPVRQPFTATIQFSESVTGFTKNDILVTNATSGTLLTADNITYTVLVTPTADGTVTMQVPASVAVNVGNNPNTASNTLSVTYDGTAPTITGVNVPTAAVYHAGQVLSFTVHFSENVLVTGTPTLNAVIGTTTRQAAYTSGSGTNSLLFSYTVQQGDMDMDGIALASPLTGTLQDAAGNNAVLTLNNAGSTAGVLVNTAHPTVVISSNAAARVNTPVTVNIIFSEAVIGLTTTDITTTNAMVSNLQSTDQINYTLVLTPITDGTFNITIPANVAVNTGNNDNTASNTLAFTYDATAPVIGVQAFHIGFDSPAGTPVGTLRATDASGVIQQWQITTDGSGGAFTIDANGALTVKDATILRSKAGTTVSIVVIVSDGLNTSFPAIINMLISAPIVNQAPTLDAIDDVMSCAGTDIHTIQLKGMSAGEPAQTYSLSVTAGQPYFDVLTVDHSGLLHYQLKSDVSSGVDNITVTIRDDGGTAYGGVDTRQQTFRITVNSLPIVTITSNKGNTVSKGDLVQLTATGGTSYNWEPADNIISGQNSAVLQARVLTNNTYTVTVGNAAGCSYSSSINIATVADFKVEATNIMTPNGDGKNDKWMIRNLDSYPDNEVKIFDRTGRIVYQRKNYSNDWDGTMNGSPLAEGTYYYILTIGGGAKTAKGYITLIRDQR